jgi:4'-phosphopantetheinyl transferase
MSLAEDRVYVSTILTGGTFDAHLMDRWSKLLTPEEILRSQQFKFRKDQYFSILGRALVRTELSKHCDVRPHQWRFSSSEFGKPVVSSEFPPLRFNLTHTDGLVACVVSPDLEVGIDAEHIAKNVDIDIGRTIFSPSEVKYLEGVPPALSRDAFFELWTLKEAYLKTCGVGLSAPLDSFSIHLHPANSPTISFAEPCLDSESKWSFFQDRPDPSHHLAVCVQHQSDNRIQMRLTAVQNGLVEQCE